MPYNEDAQTLIHAIKAKVHLLEWDDDYLAMDKACGEIDLLMYKLRQLVIGPVIKRDRAHHDWLKDLEEEILNEKSLP